MDSKSETYSGAVREVIELKGPEVLLDPRLFANCLRDVVGQSWSNEFKIAERNLDAAMLEVFYNAVLEGTSEVQAAARKVADQLQFDYGLSESMAKSIAGGLGEGLKYYANAEERYVEGDRCFMEGKYGKAFEVFSSLGSHRDAESRALRSNALLKLDRKYEKAKTDFAKAVEESQFIKLAKTFESLSGFRSSERWRDKCLKNAERAKNAEEAYKQANAILADETLSSSQYEEGCRLFEGIAWYKDAEQRASLCRQLAIRSRAYEDAANLLCYADSLGEYKKAQILLTAATGFKDSDLLMERCRVRIAELELDCDFENAKTQLNSAKTADEFEAAARLFESFGSHKDAVQLANLAESQAEEARKKEAYTHAIRVMNSAKHEGAYEKAAKLFEDLGDYENSSDRALACWDAVERIRAQAEQEERKRRYEAAVSLMKSATTAECYIEAKRAFAEIWDYDDAQRLSEKCGKCAEECEAQEEAKRVEEAYSRALDRMGHEKTEKGFLAIAAAFADIKPYRDSEKLEAECRSAAEAVRKDTVLKKAELLIEAAKERSEIQEYQIARVLGELSSIESWKNAEALAEKCQELLRKKERKEKRKVYVNRLIVVIGIVSILAILTILILDRRSALDEEEPIGSFRTEEGLQTTNDGRLGDWSVAQGALCRIRFGIVYQDGDNLYWRPGEDDIESIVQARRLLRVALYQMTESETAANESLKAAELWTWHYVYSSGTDDNWVLGSVKVDDEVWYYKVVFESTKQGGLKGGFTIVISSKEFDPLLVAAPKQLQYELQHQDNWEWK